MTFLTSADISCFINSMDSCICDEDHVKKRITRMTIHNIREVEKFPDFIKHCSALETLKLTHCPIETCDDFEFPDSVRSIDLSYLQLRTFEPSDLPHALAELSLAFNKLEYVSEVLLRAHARGTTIDLSHNDFWFTRYTNYSISRLVKDYRDLKHAYVVGLFGTSRMLGAICDLQKNGKPDAANELRDFMQKGLIQRQTELSAIVRNNENVHLSSVQCTLQTSIALLRDRASSKENFSLEQLIEDAFGSVLTPTEMEYLQKRAHQNNLVHTVAGTSFGELLGIVLRVCTSLESAEASTVYEILKSDLIDAPPTCLLGELTRMVTALSGIVPDVRVTISDREELLNRIIATRRSVAKMYDATCAEGREAYISAAVPMVKKLLQEACIPEDEQEAWLEYV